MFTAPTKFNQLYIHVYDFFFKAWAPCGDWYSFSTNVNYLLAYGNLWLTTKRPELVDHEGAVGNVTRPHPTVTHYDRQQITHEIAFYYPHGHSSYNAGNHKSAH